MEEPNHVRRPENCRKLSDNCQIDHGAASVDGCPFTDANLVGRRTHYNWANRHLRWICSPKLNQSTSLGSALDSLADNILIISMVIWLFLLRPEVLTGHPILLLAAISIALTSLLVGLLKFRQVANLHLYSAKVFGVVGHVFVMTCPPKTDPTSMLGFGSSWR